MHLILVFFICLLLPGCNSQSSDRKTLITHLIPTIAIFPCSVIANRIRESII